MALDDEDIRLVRESLPLIAERLEPASLLFYENLFTIAPDLRRLFRDDLAGQGMRFMTTLSTIAEVLDDPQAREAQIKPLARVHTALGTRPEHFAPMGSALLVTLGETLGPAFTPRLQEAWRAAYEAIAAEMIADARSD
jgi:nitric oxide dioxygenase